jgi:hypothetical protein
MLAQMLPAEALLKRTYDRAVNFWRENSPAGRTIARKRAQTDAMLDVLARKSEARFNGVVLVDASFDNPNYWLRFSLLRSALGLAYGHEIGLLGEFRRNQCRATLRRLGINRIESYPDITMSLDTRHRADTLIAKTKSPEHILTWKLPDDINPSILYDGILKRQRLAAVDVRHPGFPRLVHEALASIERSRRLLDRHKFDLLVISHPFNFALGTLAWQALARGTEAVLPFGLFGGLRFTRFFKPDDLARFYDRPTRAEIDDLPPHKAEALAAVGRAYIQGRLSGAAGDLASQYAFQHNRSFIDRAQMCCKFGWDSRKPIIGFYASNWYDWPHQLGMTQFRDFLDWTQATYQSACANNSVNWLFKPHPAEDWFGGVGLADVFAGFGVVPHVALAEKTWNNAHVMQSIDALVTYHGTAGIEFAAQGKPVLVPDRGKYDDCGFVVVAENRQTYINLLARDWWRDVNLEDARRRAEIFAGWWFCMPDWQRGFLLKEDATQDALYDSIPSLLRNNHTAIDRELLELRAWWQSGHPYYHTSKMARADHYVLSNIGKPSQLDATISR